MLVDENGTPTHPTIVFLHGGGVGGWSWKPVAAALSDFHALIPDLPEHGQSAGIGPFSIRDAAERVAALIRERSRNGRAHVVGLSLGAQIGVQLLATVPEVVDHAVLTGTLVRPIPGASLIDLTMRLYAPFKDWPPLIRANMRALGVPDAYYPQFSDDTRRLTPAGLGRVTRENMSFALPDLRHAAAPTLILIGQKERGLIRQSARDLLAALPNARVAIVSGGVHNWPLAQPDLCAQVIRAWIKGWPLPPELETLPATVR